VGDKMLSFSLGKIDRFHVFFLSLLFSSLLHSMCVKKKERNQLNTLETREKEEDRA
jgi:hypothetical protein